MCLLYRDGQRHDEREGAVKGSSVEQESVQHGLEEVSESTIHRHIVTVSTVSILIRLELTSYHQSRSSWPEIVRGSAELCFRHGRA